MILSNMSKTSLQALRLGGNTIKRISEKQRGRKEVKEVEMACFFADYTHNKSQKFFANIFKEMPKSWHCLRLINEWTQHINAVHFSEVWC